MNHTRVSRAHLAGTDLDSQPTVACRLRLERLAHISSRPSAPSRRITAEGAAADGCACSDPRCSRACCSQSSACQSCVSCTLRSGSAPSQAPPVRPDPQATCTAHANSLVLCATHPMQDLQGTQSKARLSTAVRICGKWPLTWCPENLPGLFR